VVDDVLSVSAVGERIHGTLEKTITDKYPHVYWGGSDLGLGAQRYPSQWNAIPPGWQPGPEGATARPKVEQVLNDFVSDTIVPKVQSHLPSLTYKDYAWPKFDDLIGS